MKVYISSTLKNEYNFGLNPKVCDALEQEGVKVYLPQRNTNQNGSPADKFEQNIKAIRDCDAMVAIMSNPSRNLTAEIGYSHGLGKPVIALKNSTDEIDVMVAGMLKTIIEADELNDIPKYLEKLKNSLQN